MISESRVLKEKITNLFPGCDAVFSGRKHQRSERTHFILFRAKIGTEFGGILNKPDRDAKCFKKYRSHFKSLGAGRVTY
jgi:hypothetical protein